MFRYSIRKARTLILFYRKVRLGYIYALYMSQHFLRLIDKVN